MIAQTPAERIRQRRAQMIIHSFLYYGMDDPIFSDDTWQRWANDLADLQRTNPDDIGFYDDAFRGWTGDTGMHLPQDDWAREKALQVRTIWLRMGAPTHHAIMPSAVASAPAPPPAPAPAAPAPAPAMFSQGSLF